MSQGLHTRYDLTRLLGDTQDEQLRNVRIEAPSHRPIPLRLYRAGRWLWNAGIVLLVGVALYGLLVLLFSVDATADVAADSERHWQIYQTVREP